MASRSNMCRDGDFRMPRYHRRARVPLGKLRTITEHLVGRQKAKRRGDDQRYFHVVKPTLSQRDAYYEDEFQREIQKMRRHIKDLFTHIVPAQRIIEDVTGKGAEALLSTPLWPGGPAWQALPGMARADLPTSEK